MQSGDAVTLDVDGLDALIRALGAMGYETRGPVVRDGAVVPGTVSGVADLPRGWHDEQAPGRYRLQRGEDDDLFGWAVGPGSWKAAMFPPTQELWHMDPPGDGAMTERAGAASATGGASPAPAAPSATSVTITAKPRALALIGARPCEAAAMAILDRVLLGGAVADPCYEERRDGAFVVVAECGSPSATCFCTSMGTGPGAGGEYDIALTEIGAAGNRRYLARAGTERGAAMLDAVPVAPAGDPEAEERERVLAAAEAAIGRRLDTGDLASLLARNLEHPRWDEVAERCLACGNCTLVCPTCFCSDVRDTTDVWGGASRTRSWASCFDLDHSYVHGGPVRSSTSSRYRQWLTHKLSTWWDQFDTSGCVGCGRCIAWCPVGIDLTEEAAAIRADDRGAAEPAAGNGPPAPTGGSHR